MLAPIHPANEALLNVVAGPDLTEEAGTSPDAAPPVMDSCADMFQGRLFITSCHIIENYSIALPSFSLTALGNYTHSFYKQCKITYRIFLILNLTNGIISGTLINDFLNGTSSLLL